LNNARTSMPVDPEYTAALGLAVYAFALLEWNAVWCCEKLKPGIIDDLDDRTAGRVADTLLSLVKHLPGSWDQSDLLAQATRFQALTRTRNNLLHARPGTSSDGNHRLFRDGDQWTLDEIKAVADAFCDCGMRLDAHLHGFLDRP
jgi:hypothetical protein